MKKGSKVLAIALAAAMTISSLATAAPTTALAAKKPKKITKLTVSGVDVKSKKTVKAVKGAKLTVKVKTTKPASASKKANQFKYKSSKKKVAKISKKGVITVKKTGTTKITVTSKKNKKAKLTFKLTVVKNSAVTLSVTPASQTLDVGKSFQITAKTNIAGGKGFTYKSSNEKAVAVNAKGLVTAKTAGTTANITVTSKDNPAKKAVVKVTVKAAAGGSGSGGSGSGGNGGGNTPTPTPGPVTPGTVKVSEVTVSLTPSSVKVGGTVKATATVSPADAKDYTLEWKSYNTDIASVAADGTVTGKKEGTTYVIAKVTNRDGSPATGSCKLTVTSDKPETVAVTKVSLSNTKLEMNKGDTKKLVAYVEPEDAADKSVEWQTSNAAVAKVDNGTVTAVGAGTATITVRSTYNPDINAKCEVTVKENEVPVEINIEKIELDVPGNMVIAINGELDVEVLKCFPENATQDRTVSYESTKPEVATVDQSGHVKAVAPGKTTIIVRLVANPNVKAECEITVLQDAEVKVDAGGTTITKDAEALKFKSDDSSFVLDAKDIKADNETLHEQANKVWTIDTVYDLMKNDNISTYKTVNKILDAKFGTSKSETIASNSAMGEKTIANVDFEDAKVVELKNDAKIVEDPDGTRGKVLQLDTGKGKRNGAHAILGNNYLKDADFSDGVVVSMDVRATEDQSDWTRIFGLGLSEDIEKSWCYFDATSGFIIRKDGMGTGYKDGVYPGGHWVAGNKIGGSGTGYDPSNLYNYFQRKGNAEKWYNVAYAFEKNVIKVYIDGDLSLQFTEFGDVSKVLKELNKGHLTIGSGIQPSGQDCFGGYIDNVKVTALKTPFIKNIDLGEDNYKADVTMKDGKTINVDVTGAKQFKIKDLTLTEEPEETEAHELKFVLATSKGEFNYILKIYKGQNTVELYDAEDKSKAAVYYKETADAYELKDDETLFNTLLDRIGGFENPFEKLQITY